MSNIQTTQQSFRKGQKVKIPHLKLTGKIMQDEQTKNGWQYGVLISYSKPKDECPFDLRWFWESELEA